MNVEFEKGTCSFYIFLIVSSTASHRKDFFALESIKALLSPSLGTLHHNSENH